MPWKLPEHPANAVQTREDLIAFVTNLSSTVVRDTEGSRPVDEYLGALARWIGDADGWYANFGQDLPVNGDWTFFARALAAAVIYE